MRTVLSDAKDGNHLRAMLNRFEDFAGGEKFDIIGKAEASEVMRDGI